MSDKTKIEWTDSTWNPITGCSVISAGCKNCYAMKLAGTRMKNHPSRVGLTQDTSNGPVWNGQVRFNREWLTQPLQWKRPRMVFVCAHSDLFHEGVPDEWIDEVFAVMALAPRHTFQVLTKRPERMLQWFARRYGQHNNGAQLLVAGAMNRVSGRTDADLTNNWPLPNVQIGISAENQPEYDYRVQFLMQVPAAVRWVSLEPLLGPIDLALFGTLPRSQHANYTLAYDVLHWVVVGGESGPNARPMHGQWAYSLLDQCKEAGVPFLFKQWGEWTNPGAPSFGVAKGEVRHIRSDGTFWDESDEALQDVNADALTVVRVGKKAAGRLLGGVLHDGYPGNPACACRVTNLDGLCVDCGKAVQA